MTSYRKARRLTCLLFDLGWTLVDESAAQEGRARSASLLLAEAGIEVSPSRILHHQEEGATAFAPSVFLYALEAAGAPPVLARRIAGAPVYPKEMERMYEGVPELLRSLAGRYRLCAVANQSPGTDARLRALGIRQYFVDVVASAEEGVAKPDPAIFRLALSRLGCLPAEAVVIGDRLDNDIAPARSLGMATIRVLQGYNRLQVPRGREEEPDITVPRIGLVADAISRLERGQVDHSGRGPTRP